jgi:GrpB-like predicted nucleotidyltransferase (UPF0157 family)
VSDFTAAGLGLQYGTVRLVKTDDAWGEIGRELAAETARTLGDASTAVEHVGSTAVPGLLAKPIIDLAIAVPPGVTVDLVAERLSKAGWSYRGDAGDEGGWVFVLEDAPWHRVAHAHGVETGGPQWVRYIQFRELLRKSPTARATYEATKLRLAEQHPDGRKLYAAGKNAAVQGLLEG